jgi:hypothetical protein
MLCDVYVLKTLRFGTLTLCAATFSNITSSDFYVMLLYVGLQVPVSAAGAAGRGGGGQVQPRQCVHRTGQAVPEPSSITGKPNLETPKPAIASRVSKYRKHSSIHCKKGYRFSRPQTGCHQPNSPWLEII